MSSEMIQTLFLPQSEGGLELEERSDRGATDPPRINGVAAVYYDGSRGSEYQLGPDVVERIAPGAFDSVIDQDVRAVFNHDPSAVLGRVAAGTLRLELAAGGLSYSVDPPNTVTGREVTELIRRGDVDGSSFRFRVAPDGQTLDRDGELTIRTITKIRDLVDVGPVTWPAYEATSSATRAALLDSVRDERRAMIAAEINARYEILRCRS